MSEFEGSPEDLGDKAEREGRRAEREARRAERESRRHQRGWHFAFGGMGIGPDDAAEASSAEERRFQVSGTPHVRVGNVSGETSIEVGQAGEVLVRARKRVRGWSEDRARRLLENIEIRMEQNGDEIAIQPRLFEQERGWLDLFRGGRVAVDLDIRVPQEAHLEASTVSGELSLKGTRGHTELRSVSGDVTIDDVQGPLRVRTVSGDVNATSYAGQLEANSVSGDIEMERSRVRIQDIVTVSGDMTIDSAFGPDAGSEARLKTVSGDIELTLGEGDVEMGFHTMSGDADVEGATRVEKEGRRDRKIVFGSGRARFRVRSVSGDLAVGVSREATSSTGEAEAAIPMEPPQKRGTDEVREEARRILERVSRGDLSVDDAAAALDEARQR